MPELYKAPSMAGTSCALIFVFSAKVWSVPQFAGLDSLARLGAFNGLLLFTTEPEFRLALDADGPYEALCFCEDGRPWEAIALLFHHQPVPSGPGSVVILKLRQP